MCVIGAVEVSLCVGVFSREEVEHVPFLCLCFDASPFFLGGLCFDASPFFLGGLSFRASPP